MRIFLPTSVAKVTPTPLSLNVFFVLFFDSIAAPVATSIEAICDHGISSGWIIIRGSSINGLSARIKTASTTLNVSTKLLPLNYSSFDLAAFVYRFVDETENISISLSSDGFKSQIFPIGFLGMIVSFTLLNYCTL